MTTVTDKIQYRVVTKDLTFSGYTVLEKGQLVKIKQVEDGTYFLMNHPRGFGGFSSESEMNVYTRKAKKKDIKRIKKQFMKEEAEFSLRKINEYRETIHQAIKDMLNKAIDKKTLPTEISKIYIDDLITFTESYFKDYVEYANMKPKELETDTVLYL